MRQRNFNECLDLISRINEIKATGILTGSHAQCTRSITEIINGELKSIIGRNC